MAASDGFFPYAGSALALARGGATAIIQPGGAMKDAEAIQVVDGAGMSVVFERQAPLPQLTHTCHAGPARWER